MSRNDHERWQMDLEEYIRQGEPEQSEKSTAWKTAIGLQDVDGLNLRVSVGNGQRAY